MGEQERVTNAKLYEELTSIGERFDTRLGRIEGRVDSVANRVDGMADRLDDIADKQDKLGENQVTLGTNQLDLKSVTNEALHEMMGKLEAFEGRITNLETPWKFLARAVSWGTSNWQSIAGVAVALGGIWVALGFPLLPF